MISSYSLSWHLLSISLRDYPNSRASSDVGLCNFGYLSQMQGLDDLRRGRQTDASASCQLDPTVAAPKIQRFCEEYMSLVGRTIASRLMLELSPFMDTSVAGSSAAPTESTREELVATRRRLDEVSISSRPASSMSLSLWVSSLKWRLLCH